MNVVKSKSVSDADTQFIVDRLNSEFKTWGSRVVHKLTKHGLKLKDYVTQLRSTFLTNELPLEFISLIIDQYLIEGDYALVRAVLTFLYLKWSHPSEVKTSDISISLFFKAMSELKLKRSGMVNKYYSLKQQYTDKVVTSQIFCLRVECEN